MFTSGLVSNRSLVSRRGVLLMLLLLSTHAARAGEVRETYDDGKPKLHYRTDDKDRRTGPYEEFFPGGKVHIRGTYIAGKKTGQWSTWAENSKVRESATYRNDVLEGPYQWNFESGQ